MRVPYEWDEPLIGGAFLSISPDGTVEYETKKRLVIAGSYSSNITVRTVERGQLELSGNPVKFMQGHNLFGTDDLKGLLSGCLERIMSVLNQPVSARDLNAWRSGAGTISRVDCTQMYELDSKEDVLAWLRAAEAVAVIKWRGRGHYDPGTLDFGRVAKGKRAKDWSIVLYCKGEEITKPGHHLADGLPRLVELFEWAQNKLRIEVRLRTNELKRLGLVEIREWSEAHVQQMVDRYLGKIEIGEEVMVHVDVEAQLKPSVRAALALWRSGADLRSVYPKNTFYRHRRELLAMTGIDISARCPGSNVVPLRRVLQLRPVSLPIWSDEVMYRPERGNFLRVVGAA